MTNDPSPPDNSVPAGSPAAPQDLQPLPLDFDSPQLTLRALLTGMVLGGVLSICNIYTALKVGLVFNMAIPAILLGYGFWTLTGRLSGGRVRTWGILENNVNQTACSSGAMVASAGLAGPIPALALLTGQTLDWFHLALWVFSVCLVGIAVGIGLRRQMLLRDKLPFAAGVACAATLREMHAKGREALTRMSLLFSGAVLAAGLKLLESAKKTSALVIPGTVKGFTLESLGFSLDPTLMLYGIGALIGIRAGVSLLIGAVLVWGVLAPALLQGGHIHMSADKPTFQQMVQWTLWPGVTLMVVAGLVSLAFSWRSAIAAFTGVRRTDRQPPANTGEIGRGVFLAGLIVALALSVWLQVSFFAIVGWAAVAGVLLSFVLALVGARVSGETGITPVAQMGKVSQVLFASLTPQSPVPNLMAANVTGGAASQCADLLNDYKCGYLVGASPRLQTLAQIGGVLAGALVGTAAYLALVPNPSAQLLTPELPAPGVAGMKAVAELFQAGFQALPTGTGLAMLIAAIAGIVLTVVEKTAPQPARAWIPSAASLGLAFVFPASVSCTLFLGGLLAFLLSKWFKSWTTRFLVTICAGIVAGESITSVGVALHKIYTS